jgi:glutamate N-acetyltransferase / amino-acid N-acetyltransferase
LKLPLGYKFAATYAGIRKQHKDDLGLIVSNEPASAAAVFTTNQVQAAPVKIAREHLRASRGKLRAIIVNAGNANCATRTGEQVAVSSCKAVANALKSPLNQIIPASTGVIGVEMDGEKVVRQVPELVKNLSEHHFPDVAMAMMTTDLNPKTSFGDVQLKEGTVHIAGMTKGSGMIAPNMATTLGFVMTDAVIAPVHLHRMLQRCVDKSYNRVSVDGDMSTNDIITIMANGAANLRPTEKERQKFEEVLQSVLEDMAEQIARDGEGARKLIRIRVMGASDEKSAEVLSRAIGMSPLVKTAMGGADANWGRILSAAGGSGIKFDPNRVDIYLQGTLVCQGGMAAPFDEERLQVDLNDDEVTIRFVIRGDGQGDARFWTCDLTDGYVRINSSYRS